MNARVVSRLAWSGFLVSAVLGIAALVMDLGTGRWSLSTMPRSLSFLLFSLVGAAIVTRDRRNAIGWIFSALGLAFMAMLAKTSYLNLAPRMHAPGTGFVAWLDWLWVPIGAVAVVFIPLLFPTGRLLSPRWRVIVWAAIAFVAIGATTDMLAPGNSLGLHVNERLRVNLNNLSALPLLFAAAGALGSLVVRFRRSAALERQQLKWFVAASVPVVLGFGLHGAVSQQVTDALISVGLIALPISVGVAILRYRLYDIDVVISKSLVYGSLAAFITAVYVGIVVGIGALLGSGGRPNLALSIVATAIVAVAFQPVRERLQRVANRVVYGQRSTPYEVMTDFSDRMAGALSLDEVLPRMAQVAAEGVGAQVARVSVVLPDGGQWDVNWPKDQSADNWDQTLPIAYRDQRLGELAIRKAAGEPLIPAERKLLSDLATQAGLVLHNVRLSIDLQARLAEISKQAAELRASRLRLVSAQDAERQRLEQTIHDGAERQLAAIASELSGIPEILAGHPSEGITILERLMEEANATLEGLRDLARGIYPPLLRDSGLKVALEAQVKKSGRPILLEMERVNRYPSEVEGAVYFCCLEAMRHATGPSRIRIAAGDGRLDFSMVGARLDDRAFQQMEDRIEALGGRLNAEAETLVGSLPFDQFFLAASQAATSRSGSNLDFAI